MEADITAGSMSLMQGDMPGCPPRTQIKLCGGKATCPIMTICVGKCFQTEPIVIESPSPPIPLTISVLDPRDDDQWASHSPSPPSRPPRL